MKVEHFCQLLIRDLASFHAWWRLRQIENPEAFPPEGSKDEWLERLAGFCEAESPEDKDEDPQRP